MRVASIRLQNFKRFADLVIRDIPETAKLVVVVGPNGCGKSSLFDPFLQWYRGKTGFGFNNDDLYYRKDAQQPFNLNESVTVNLHGSETARRGCLYVRTAYRNDPDFSISELNRPAAPSETVRVGRTIENDQTVSQNYQRLVYETMTGVYNSANDAKTVLALREELIGQVRASMKRVFGDLLLNSISDPLGSGAFFFGKGAAKSFHYKNLSGGEKAAFDLLLDLHTKKSFFADAIYCIDEVETHLHTRVQGVLLKELVNVLPEPSQLWVTTHSLGVLRAAQEMAAADPASVCVIDFDGADPDVPRELVPSNLGRVSWEKLLSIALDDLSQQIAPKVVVVCEGSSMGTRRKDFDAEIYNRILGSHYPDVLFVSGGSSNQVASTGVSVRETLSRILPSAKIWSLADRDDKSDKEVAEMEASKVITLPQRNLESFLFANDVIEALVMREQKQEQLESALEVKRQALANSVTRGNQSDDLKSAAGEIYIGLKKLLGLQRCGNTSDAFMRDTLAPLITPTMRSFQALKAAIIDGVL
ncbi:MAG: AAA family ATPase [Acidobacteriota bacterium]|nr:AAA family ATPase [Acidobacteriota bacterium]